MAAFQLQTITELMPSSQTFVECIQQLSCLLVELQFTLLPMYVYMLLVRRLRTETAIESDHRNVSCKNVVQKFNSTKILKHGQVCEAQHSDLPMRLHNIPQVMYRLNASVITQVQFSRLETSLLDWSYYALTPDVKHSSDN